MTRRKKRSTALPAVAALALLGAVVATPGTSATADDQAQPDPTQDLERLAAAHRDGEPPSHPDDGIGEPQPAQEPREAGDEFTAAGDVTVVLVIDETGGNQ